ncbi:MAG: class I SAM-dependent methyltransferase, partial [Bacillota bacterium]
MDNIAEKTHKALDETLAPEQALVPLSRDTGIPAVDESLDWLCRGSRSVIDFGCGSGAMLFLCALRGTKNHFGIDPSPAVIRLARENAVQMKRGRYRFIEGGFERLGDIKDASADAAILCNIVD